MILGYTKRVSDGAAYLNVPPDFYDDLQSQQVVYTVAYLSRKRVYGARHKISKVLKQGRLVLL